MKKKNEKSRQSYSPEFKAQAIELAKEIGAKEAAEKLGIKSSQTLGAWIRYSKRMNEDAEFREFEEAKAEIKKLRKQAEEDKKVIAILKDAAAFFCQDHLK
ncbi:MAG: hypothetical protein COV37_10020 [Bdellovibrio sp. CG11_big_fil_rev_8_21_14_0_20_39_38]|nr:MAG: hypothetical protein COV37_10020 [Bdellovibrio sp. CG11_big_fil_rev_8_21_14_0_20_39_38]